MRPQKPNDEEKLEKLANDFDTPFSEPVDIPRTLPQAHQFFDADDDSQEIYDSGQAGDRNIDQTAGRPAIRPSRTDDSRQHGPVRVVKPAHRPMTKIYGED